MGADRCNKTWRLEVLELEQQWDCWLARARAARTRAIDDRRPMGRNRCAW